MPRFFYNLKKISILLEKGSVAQFFIKPGDHYIKDPPYEESDNDDNSDIYDGFDDRIIINNS
jgi:hypothetical protein